MIARALLLVVVAARVAALESWGIPDVHEQDKQGHAAAGAAIAEGVSVAVRQLAPSWRPWQRMLVATAASAVAGTVHEALKAPRGRDPKDAIATAAGGVVGAVCVELVWRF